MREIIIARRYAQSFFITSLKNKTSEKNIQEIKNILDFFTANKNLFKILDHPFARLELKEAILNQAIVKFPQEIKNFTHLLLQKNRIQLLPEIYAQLIFFQDQYLEQEKGKVVSSVDLSEDEKKLLENKLQNILHKKLILIYEVSPKILGGIFIQIGNRVFDGTVRGALKKLRKKLITHYG